MIKKSIKVYTDYKSPYAYLAKDLIYELAEATGVGIDWLAYTLDIPAYLGRAELDASGAIVSEQRNAHQWRRVKYSYMDCRREANRRGLTIRGTRKIWDSIGVASICHASKRCCSSELLETRALTAWRSTL